MQVLVVDDSSAMRRIHQKALEGLGWQVHTAEDGQLALAHLQKSGAYALLVTDLHMPNMDGLQLIEAVRKDAQFAAMKILMITSDGVLDVVEKAMNLGANDLLIKPYPASVFAERIESLCRGG